MEEKLENIEEKLESTEEKAESAEERPESAGEKPESTEKKPESAEERLESKEEKPESTGEAETEKAVADGEKDGKDEKKSINKKRIAGYVELTAAFILAALSVWMFINTRGTRLLYVSVTTGRISRYYWIFLAIAVIFAALGLITLKGQRREGRKNQSKKGEKTSCA